MCGYGPWLLLGRAIDIDTREPPYPADLEGRDLLGGCEPVDRSLRDFQVAGDLPAGEDFALVGVCGHGDRWSIRGKRRQSNAIFSSQWRRTVAPCSVLHGEKPRG